ncbi:MAG: adenylyl-sulfate kinase [Thermodesulfobacteriota bacterium]
MAAACTIWLSGRPRAGKSTLGAMLAAELAARGCRVQLLDGGELRRQLSPELGFGPDERRLHHLRAAYLAGLLNRHGVFCVAALIAPYAGLRAELRRRLPGMALIHLDCGLEQAVNRDQSGLYARALAGEIERFTGLDDPYEDPLDADLRLMTDRETPAQSLARLLGWLTAGGRVPAPAAPAGGPAYTATEAADIARRLEQLGYW